MAGRRVKLTKLEPGGARVLLSVYRVPGPFSVQVQPEVVQCISDFDDL